MTSAVPSRLGVRTKATTRPLTVATYPMSVAASSCAAHGEKPKTPPKPMAETTTAALVTFAEIIGLPLQIFEDQRAAGINPKKALAGPPNDNFGKKFAEAISRMKHIAA